MGFWLQLRILLWKNFMLRKRQPVRIAIEIIWPLLLFLILAWVRTRGLQDYIHECHFDGKPMPSAGILPFLQGMVCTGNNTCHKNIRLSEMSGNAQEFNNSVITRLFEDIEAILGNSSEIEELTHLIEDYNTLQELGNISINGSSKGGIKIGNLFVHPENLRKTIASQNISISPSVIDSILNASIDPRALLEYTTSLNSSQLQNETVIQMLQQLRDFNWSAGNVRELTCNLTQTQQVIIYKSTAEAQQVKDAVCNLTMAQFRQLVDDFRKEYSFWRVVEEMSKYAENNTGRKFNFNNSTYRRWRQIIDDIQNLDSFSSFLSDANETYQDTRESYGNNITANESMRELSSVLCGDSGMIFQSARSENLYGRTEQEGDPEADKPKKETYEEEDEDYVYDNSTTAYCNDIFKRANKQRGTRILWRQLKPLIRGKLPYYPDNDITREIIKQANNTFVEMASFMRIAKDYLDYSPTLHKALNGSQGDNLRRFFSWCNQTLTGRVKRTCAFYGKYLYNGPKIAGRYDWRDSLRYLDNDMKELYQILQCFEYNKFEPHADEESLVKASLHYIDVNKYWGGIVFDLANSDKTNVTHVKYKIRMDVDKVDGTENFKVLDRYWSPGPRARAQVDLKYFTYGFAYIQDMIEHGIIRAITGKDVELGVYGQQFPYPCYISDRFTQAISRSIPMFMVLAWVYTAAMIVKGVVYEKEKRLKEVMKVMGLSNGVHWLAWFINSFVMMLISVILLVLVLKYCKVLMFSDPSVILVFLLAFTVATIMQCFLISVFFSRANLAAACAGLIYFTLYLPYPFMETWEEYMTTSQKAAGCLLSNVAFGFGCKYIARYEEQGVGIQWSNVNDSPMPDDGFSMFQCIILMLSDALIYWILTWYIEAVFPGQYGMPRPWYFLFTKYYWCGTVNTKGGMDSELEMGNQSSAEIEKEPTNLPLGVGIRNMKKVYSRGKKVAVNGLSLNFYEDQITSFLGHNGAGKTTTMSILTGLFPPTDGTALIYNKDIRTEMDNIRQSLGMCPQYNVLFDKLTVEEHLWFYGRLKGMDEAGIQREMDQMIKDVGLPHKRKEPTTSLSGGMKRKLSVAVAFIGGSRCVILDEPTAGVDPYARRAIWELLLKYRKGRTIILSTHHMDEADTLGDRIAIIAEGKLKCCGSSLFLKGRYGSGYYLTLAKMDESRMSRAESRASTATPDSRPQSARTLRDVELEENDDLAEVEKSIPNFDAPGSLPTGGKRFDEAALTKYIRSYVPDAVLIEDIGTELTYQLPEEGAKSGTFQQLFSNLDEDLEDLGISSYGISDTSLEEVFLKVAEDCENDAESDENKRQKLEKISDDGKYPRPVSRLSFRRKKLGFAGFQNGAFTVTKGDKQDLLNGNLDDTDSVISMPISEPGDCHGAGSYKVSPGCGMIRREFMALFIKRFHHVRRSKKGFIAEIILPSVFVLLAMIFAMIIPPIRPDPPMEVHPWLLTPKEGGLSMFYSNDAPPGDFADKYVDMLTSKIGIGTRCMDPKVHSIANRPCFPDKDVNFTPIPKMTGNLTIDSPECSCKTGYQQCPVRAGGPEPSKYLHPGNTDTIYNMTGRNITDWLAKTMENYLKRRYGGYSFEVNSLVRDNATVLYDSLNRLSTAANNGKSVMNGSEDFWDDVDRFLKGADYRNVTKIWFNNKGYVSFIGYMNALNNMILRANLPPGKDTSQYGITLIQHPMNLTKGQILDETWRQGAVDVLIAICVIFALSFIPASFVLYLIDERVHKSKHLQFVSGVTPYVYWLSNITWDIVNYIIPAIICMLIFVAFDKKAYVSSDNAPVLLCLLLLYGWAIIPMMYPACYIFSIPSSAFVSLSTINVFIGMTTTISTFIIELLEWEDPQLANINKVLKQVFLCFPQYCLGRGLVELAQNQLYADTLSSFGEDTFTPPFQWDLCGRNLFALFLQGIIFFALTMLLEYRFFCKPRKISPKPKTKEFEDDDVAHERERVLSGAAKDEVLLLENLTKVYKTRKGKHTAVDHLCLGVPKGQCFGLLGVNGAGKTSTFQMLTGDTHVTEGSAHVASNSILTAMTAVHKNLGYCPQFDALDSLLTGREHLMFYARLRGVPEPEVKKVADWAIRKLGLVPYADKVAGDYSGGNRRKLSTAIALIGNPPIIFLDEPTTGMDPKARRFLWNCITSIIKDGRSVILTSHSMEECEALCNRISIMVNGQFKCIGSIQHLKNKFGDGYTIVIRLKGHNPDMHHLTLFFQGAFPYAVQKELHHNMVQYQIPSGEVSLARIFEKLEGVRDELEIEDYSVSQTTLDQVFINFAKLQTDILDDEELAEAAKAGMMNGRNGVPRKNSRNGIRRNSRVGAAPADFPDSYDDEKSETEDPFSTSWALPVNRMGDGWNNPMYANMSSSTPSLQNGQGAWQGDVQMRDDAESEMGSTLNLIRQNSERSLQFGMTPTTPVRNSHSEA